MNIFRGEKSTLSVTKFRRGIFELDGVDTCLWIEETISQDFLVERSFGLLCINMLTWCLALCYGLKTNLNFRTVASLELALLLPPVTKLLPTPDINFPQINSQTCISNFMAFFGFRCSSRLHKHIHLVCAFLSLFSTVWNTHEIRAVSMNGLRVITRSSLERKETWYKHTFMHDESHSQVLIIKRMIFA